MQLMCVDYPEFPVLTVPWLTLDKANVTFHRDAWEEMRLGDFWRESWFPAYGYNNELRL